MNNVSDNDEENKFASFKIFNPVTNHENIYSGPVISRLTNRHKSMLSPIYSILQTIFDF